jgi:hypothetical protein
MTSVPCSISGAPTLAKGPARKPRRCALPCAVSAGNDAGISGHMAPKNSLRRASSASTQGCRIGDSPAEIAEMAEIAPAVQGVSICAVWCEQIRRTVHAVPAKRPLRLSRVHAVRRGSTGSANYNCYNSTGAPLRRTAWVMSRSRFRQAITALTAETGRAASGIGTRRMAKPNPGTGAQKVGRRPDDRYWNARTLA